jgi:uncharacterized protein (TIGR02145 family)
MKELTKIIALLLLMMPVNLIKGQDAVKDHDGNVYKTLKVGSQTWMAENLKTTHFRNGQAIPDVKDKKQWDSLTTAAYCDVANDPKRSEVPGRLYNWYAVADERNVCPSGWHVPSETEWQELIKNLSEAPEAKELNAALFKILQDDFRGYDGDFSGMGYGGGAWWSSTSARQETAYTHGVNYDTASKNRLEARKKFGYSIRCIKD